MLLRDWVSSITNELGFDAVGLWQIAPAMRRGFGLSGNDLDRAVRGSLRALLAPGALPVVGSVSDGSAHWHARRVTEQNRPPSWTP